jgi:hypothetical protein
MSEQELATGDSLHWRCGGNRLWEVEAEDEAASSGAAVWAYDFPAVLGPQSTQDEAYAFVRPVVRSWLDGVNGTVLAFGQTGSGKTHTMSGVTPRALGELFERLSAERAAAPPGSHVIALISLSYLEVYNEVSAADRAALARSAAEGARIDLVSQELYDLLSPVALDAWPPPAELVVREGGAVEGLTCVRCASFADASAALLAGEARRRVAATTMNRASSRSHALLRIALDWRLVPDRGGDDDQGWALRRQSTLSLVDLAGSERARSRAAADGATWGEGCCINRGLLALGRVVAALAAPPAPGGAPPHVPWRDCKLTRLLQGALGGGARAAALCCISPAHGALPETRTTLRFAERAQHVATRALLCEQTGAAQQLAAAREEIGRLRAALAAEREAHRRCRAAAADPTAGEAYPLATSNSSPPLAAAAALSPSPPSSASASLVRLLFADMRSASEALRGVREELMRCSARESRGGADLLQRAAAAAAAADSASARARGAAAAGSGL